MAVIEHFTVRVSIDDKRCHEYNDEDLDQATAESTAATVARYIEAKSGQQFSLSFRLKKGYVFPSHINALAWDTYIDGKSVHGRVMTQEEYTARGSLGSEVDGKRSMCAGQWVKHPFTFWDLDITQDSVKLDTKSMAKYGDLGTIEVRVMPYISWGRSNRRNSRDLPVTLNESVSEKALKGRAVTLGAGLGDAIPSRPSNTHAGTIIGTEPLAKFIFHYRTRKSLQDLMVIPKDDLETMTAEELRPLLRQELANRMFKVKKESTPHTESKEKVKRGREIPLDDEILEIREVKKVKPETEVIEIED